MDIESFLLFLGVTKNRVEYLRYISDSFLRTAKDNHVFEVEQFYDLLDAKQKQACQKLLCFIKEVQRFDFAALVALLDATENKCDAIIKSDGGTQKLLCVLRVFEEKLRADIVAVSNVNSMAHNVLHEDYGKENYVSEGLFRKISDFTNCAEECLKVYFKLNEMTHDAIVFLSAPCPPPVL